MPAKTQTKSSQSWETKPIKQTKQKIYSLLRILKLLPRRQNLIPLKIPISKNVENTFLSLKMIRDYICKTWKKIIRLWRSINSENDDFFKWNQLQKLVSFCVFVFVVSKQIAHKMVIAINFVLQKTFIYFLKPQLKTNQTKNSKKITKNLRNFEPKISLRWPFNLKLRPFRQLHCSKWLNHY